MIYNIHGDVMVRILRKQTEVKYTVKRSVFIGIGAPVSSEADAKTFIASVKDKYGDATHVAWAYVVSSIEAYSDAGEPAGTAGPPILRAMKGAGITHGVICVIRYFGGIKLGKRGLIDAYGYTAKLVIESAGVVDAVEGYEIEIVHSYNVKIDGILRSLGIDIRTLSPHYTDVVRWRMKVSKDMFQMLQQRLSSVDDVDITVIGETLVEV